MIDASSGLLITKINLGFQFSFFLSRMDYDRVAEEEEETSAVVTSAVVSSAVDTRHRILYGCVGLFLVSKFLVVTWLFFFFNVLKDRFGW